MPDASSGSAPHGVREMDPSDIAAVQDFIRMPSAAKETPVLLTWRDLTVSATNANKTLLHKQSGKITRGFTAIMGPSGSGKTTLLNTLACRLDPNTKVSGEFRANGQLYSLTELKKMGAYVMQDDILNGALTVEETMRYTSKLRLPKEIGKEEREQRMNEAIVQMGLDHARNTVVGSPLIKGISGGERKRLCVAMELLTRPQLLFLDEPTSGLDSVTALSLCTSLKRVSKAGLCTVVCTIHQPQTKIFVLFDDLFLLKTGVILYQGPASSALSYFDRQGFPCPSNTNPADHLLDCITVPIGGSMEELAAAEEGAAKLKEKAREHSQDVDLELGATKGLNLSKQSIPYSEQFAILFRRCMKEHIRRPILLLTQMAQNILMAVLIGTVFLNLKRDQAGLNRRNPVLFFCVVNQGVFGALITINSFPAERVLTLRERMAGTYYVGAYFLAKVASDTLTQLPSPILFSAVVYWLVGFQLAADKFFIFMLFMVLCSMAATSLALMVSALCRTTELSVTVLPIAMEVCRLFGGFFLSPADLPHYFVWLDALSYVKYTYVGIALNEFKGLELFCTKNELAKDGTCPVTRGEQRIDKLGLDFISLWGCVGILILYITVCRFVAYLGIRFIKW